jgi:hypothetical protein
MSGGKGGSRTTSVQVPEWLEQAARGNLARADEVSRLGYVPYFGPEVAAFSPMQESAFANTGAAAGAFGLPGLLGGMPQPQEFAGGVRGYSSQPIFQQSLDALQAARPGQFDYMTGMFIDPITGAGPSTATMAAATPLVAQPGTFAPSGGGGYADAMGAGEAMGGGTGGFSLGGYSGFGDMIDGGGPGASGGQFSGGGFVSGVGNAMGGPQSIGGAGGLGGGKG